MTQDMEHLKMKVERLECLLKRQRHVTVAVVLVLLAIVGLTGAMNQQDPRNIVCNSLKVVDQDGKLLVAIGIGDHGGWIDILHKNGKPCAMVGVGDEGGVFRVQSRKERRQLAVMEAKDAFGYIRVENSKGEAKDFSGK